MPPYKETTPDIAKGFAVEIRLHTDAAREKLTSPDDVRSFLGEQIDRLKLQEEVDYTLDVRRIYEQ